MGFFHGLVAIVCFTLAEVETRKIVPSPVESPLRVGSFNIQNLGKSKTQNEAVMDIVIKILLRYDLVLVQEIVTTDESLMNNVMQQMNKQMESEGQYLMTISDRLGRGSAKEQYAFLYRSDKLKCLGAHVYPDLLDEFMRPPYIAHFSSPTIRGVNSLLAVGIHTQPKNAANETSALAQVYDYASKHYKIQPTIFSHRSSDISIHRQKKTAGFESKNEESSFLRASSLLKDAVIMGDMNAGCSNVRIGDWGSIDLWTRPEFTWLIKHDVDTTVSTNCCPYDRFVLAGENLEEAVIWDSIGVFNFRDAFGLSTPEVLAVSDHWPIEFKLKGSVSDIAEKNLRSTLCLTVDDVRKNSLPSVIENQKTTMGFKIYSDEHSVLLERSSSSIDDLMVSLAALRKKYPELLSAESLAAISYKTASGALNDTSSHQEMLDQDFQAHVEFDRQDEMTEISVCTQTSIN